MASNLMSSWKTFWHTMTSYDRHASHDSPYRTGQHVPLAQSRHAPLTSVATSAIESRADLNSPYPDDNMRAAPSATPFYGASNGFAPTSSSPYSPGMRSSSATQLKGAETLDGAATGEIPMQNFQDGLPPPPPVTHSWRRIDRWVEDNYQELFDQVCEGCTQNDLNELEHELDCSLPMDVRESLQIHDGQERGGMPTGLLFGCMLLDCEEIVHEWRNWRTVADEFLSSAPYRHPQPPVKAFGGASSSSSSQAPVQQGPNPLWRQELLEKQDSQPPRAVQKAYVHPAWIPLARDWGGNNIAVDLAPGPAGQWGQIIIFGRDYDCKYVIARSWAAFLAMVADDLGSEKVFVHEETQELKLREFDRPGVEPAYLDILRWRVDQKHGRRPPPSKRRAGPPVNTQNGGVPHNGPSPYGSPTMSARSDSPQRFPSTSLSAMSPKTQGARTSPLARVAEELPAPVTVHTGGNANDDPTATETAASERAGKLVEIATPQLSGSDAADDEAALKGPKGMTEPSANSLANTDDETPTVGEVTGLGVQGVTEPANSTKAEAEELKNVEI
ncbi:cell wall assembly and cell proliferation coordinating protein [Xylona heveae TC161]|uniref:Cell wall assembly and cell proliferation coordinating protein n=1 Tax=Xylona heveae (strain CBS 132557 / TC161) TaxID=1328760 RepID=A0A165FT94_XYLHT|nr:cell wall assembly and cell proliferation coordinating protein [Xylona heveae TC161]KZF21349.1 cell wall assembly and cell proliferation coordinating protein [Xylona heveae TC161]